MNNHLKSPELFASKIKEARVTSLEKNLNGPVSKRLAGLLRSPRSGMSYDFVSGGFATQNEIVPIKNGIPDFTIYSMQAFDEKEKQAAYHDDEETNETFDEIVLRPFNHNELHAQIWWGHLIFIANRIKPFLDRDWKGISILNCGCGGGFEAQYFAQQGATVVGFDISQLRVEAAATRFALNDLEGLFYRGDAAHLPFADNTFDLVLYHDSLHHVPIEEIPVAIREARRVSKNLIVLSEAHDSPIRMILESMGLSISIEASGNYTFRFRKSLITFWCQRFKMKLLMYHVNFVKKEHRPKLYRIPIFNYLIYWFFKLAGIVLRPFGNEALIVMQKGNF